MRGLLECGWRGYKAHAQKELSAATLGVAYGLRRHFGRGMVRPPVPLFLCRDVQSDPNISDGPKKDTRGSQRPPGGKPVLVVLQEGCGSQA